jgi:hypothetical protein
MKEVENTLKLVTEEVDTNILNGDIEEAKEKVNKQLKALVGLDIGTVDIFSFNSIEEHLSKDIQYNAEKFIAFACLMKLEGKINNIENNESSKIQYYEKSLEGFYKAYTEDDETNSKYLDDAVEVAGELSNYELSLDMDKKIFKLYELANKLDKAEDTLFYMLRKTNNDGSMILEGMRFYNRLEERELDELELGNLPMTEIEDGISELERRLGL